MPKFIKNIHDLVDLLTAKGKTGYIPRVDIDLAVYAASKDLFDVEYSKYQTSKKITDSMSVFLSDPMTLTVDVLGQEDIPDDYLHATSITGGTYGNPVREMDEATLALKRNDPLCPPDAEYPICKFYKDYIQFYPITLTNIKLTYLKNPIQPVYAYTIEDDREVYDDASSVDIEWNVTDQNKVTMGALQILGVTLSEQDLTQFAMVKAKEEV
jgi:hypothetical protein